MNRIFSPLVLLAAIGLCHLTLSCSHSHAQGLIKWHHFGRYDVPPRIYGYNLDEDIAPHYGGIKYREYYNFGRGYGYADYPGTMPNYHGDLLPKRYWPYGSSQSPKVAIFDPCEAYICVEVPMNAEVWLEGQPTTQAGTKRVFKSPPLSANQRFSYQVRAKWLDHGQQREQTQTIDVQGGYLVTVAFPSTVPQELEVATPPRLASPPIYVR
jgi:uncharacterized protein (TIGR03000 family)